MCLRHLTGSAARLRKLTIVMLAALALLAVNMDKIVCAADYIHPASHVSAVSGQDGFQTPQTAPDNGVCIHGHVHSTASLPDISHTSIAPRPVRHAAFHAGPSLALYRAGLPERPPRI